MISEMQDQKKIQMKMKWPSLCEEVSVWCPVGDIFGIDRCGGGSVSQLADEQEVQAFIQVSSGRMVVAETEADAVSIASSVVAKTTSRNKPFSVRESSIVAYMVSDGGPRLLSEIHCIILKCIKVLLCQIINLVLCPKSSSACPRLQS